MERIQHGAWRTTRRWLAPALVLVFLAAAGLPNAALAEPPDQKTAADPNTAQRLVTAINAADGPAVNELIDIDALGARVLRNIDLNAVDRARYLATLRMQHAMLGYSVAAQMGQQHAIAKLMPPSPSGAGNGFLVRITTRDADDNQAYGYLQVELGGDGRIVDWYDHSLALSMSGQLAFSAAGLLTTGQVAQLLFGKAGDAVATATLMQRLATATAAGDMRGAHGLLLQMPEAIQARREFATLRVTTARSVGMEAYREALAELARRHGEADDLQFILIDHYILSGQHELALRAVDRAARIIGDDEVMDSNRCGALVGLGRKADALAACDRAIARDAKFETPRWTRVRLALETEDAPLAIESLNGVEEAWGSRLDAAKLAANKTYAWLTKQPEFAEWAAKRGWSPAGKGNRH
jgi:hypothetical protein